MSPDDEKDSLREAHRARDREISEFLLHACHDVRSCLRAIRAHSELILKDGEEQRISDLRERLGFIAGGATTIDLLVDGLASYSIALQIEEGSFQTTRMDVVLRTVLMRLKKELLDNQAEVTYEKLPPVSGNPDRLAEVCENLLRNALRHRGQGSPRIHVAAEKHIEGWLFTFQDNGPGVEGAYLERIFKPFERLHGKRHVGPGLGLAICRAIVERHGGRIWAESNAGTGSRFLFTLPADRP